MLLQKLSQLVYHKVKTGTSSRSGFLGNSGNQSGENYERRKEATATGRSDQLQQLNTNLCIAAQATDNDGSK